MAAIQRRRLGDLLMECGLITQEELQEALAKQKEKKERLGELLITMGLVTNDDIIWALGDQLNISYVHLSEDLVDPNVARSFPLDQMKIHSFIPVFRIGNEITIVMADPLDIDALNSLESLTDEEINISIGSEEEIQNYLGKIFETPEIDIRQTGNDLITTSETGKKLLPDKLEQLFRKLDPDKALTYLLTNYLVEPGDNLRLFSNGEALMLHLTKHNQKLEPALKITIESDQDLFVSALQIAGMVTPDTSTEFTEGIIFFPTPQGPCEQRLTVVGAPGAWQLFAERPQPVPDNPFSLLEGEAEARKKMESAWREPGGLVLIASPEGAGIYQLLSMFSYLPYHFSSFSAVVLGERFWQMPDTWTYLFLPPDQDGRKEALRRALHLNPRLLLIDSLREENGDKKLLAMTGRAAGSGIRTIVGLECQTLSSARTLVGDAFFTRNTRIMAVRYLLRRNCPFCLGPIDQYNVPGNLASICSLGNVVLSRGEGCDQCDGTGTFGDIPVSFAATVTEEGLQSALVEAERRALSNLLSTGTIAPSAVRDSIRFPF